jgi:hypothetical protein
MLVLFHGPHVLVEGELGGEVGQHLDDCGRVCARDRLLLLRGHAHPGHLAADQNAGHEVVVLVKLEVVLEAK